MSRIPHRLRAQVRARAGNRCEYCCFPAQDQLAVFVVDHIRPRALGGRTVLANLAYSCPRCNSHKLDRASAIDPATGKTVRLFHPRRDSWSKHFEWSPEHPRFIVGKTAIGRATAACLQMNHPDMILARTMLVILGLLPEPSE
jgi:hypothetical protein